MTLQEQKKEVKTILKKHVNTIHCSNDLTLVQRKLFNALLFNAYHEMPEKHQYEISVNKLCELIGYASRDYKKLRKSILDLITTAIEWNVIEDNQSDNKEKWRASAIVSAAKIENGICTYEFSSVMRELLYRPEIYGKIDINMMTSFNSSYGLALYENCIRFQSISSTPWLPIATFRKLMGISENRYKNFCDLKKRVLDIAVKEVNLYSPLHIVPELKRVNKKVTQIKFKLLANQKTVMVEEKIINNADADLFNILKDEFSLSDKAASEVLNQYEPEFIKNKITLVKSSESFRTGKIRELGAYIRDALKRDYKPNKSSKILLNEMRKDKELAIKNEKAKEEEKIAKLNKQKKELQSIFLSKLTEEERFNIYTEFEKNLMKSADVYLLKSYKRYGMKSKAIQAFFNCYLADIMGKIENTNDDSRRLRAVF